MKEKGITLIEILIYSFLLFFFVSFIIAILMNFFFFQAVIKTRKDMSLSILYLLENIGKEIREAQEIVSPQPREFTQKILIKRENKNIAFSLKNGRIMKEIDEKSYFLTPEVINIRSLTFFHSKPSTESKSLIIIELEAEYQNPLKLRGYEFFSNYRNAFLQRK